MKRFFKSKFIILSCFVVMLLFSRCLYVGALLMSVETRKTIDKWKSGKYKTRIQERAGWVGPYCYYCRVKEKRLGGLYYRKIVNRQTSDGYYAGYDVKFLTNKGDTIVVNLFKDTTFLIKSSSNH